MADKKITVIFAHEFIPHLREGNRKTQAIEALRFLLFIKVPEVFGDCIS
ncbi:hypothetical protein M098_1280 [Phocaeicola vulgatus str. 3775 SR(B) 19]|nr:hypothetical protein M098_1280 [Phocaeicola vulgatus str. 3775 SR(B) 19]